MLIEAGHLPSYLHLPILDSRSPSEFASGHIPGSLNIPLFTDTERAEIGTLYKKNGKETAVLRGLEIVGPKLSDYIRQAKAAGVKNECVMYCWRGGMRSESMAWLFEKAGIQVYRIQGGYKSFRNLVLDSFSKPRKLILLSGYTCSGKTEILHALSERAEQILDLEGLAEHKGSAFGGLGQKAQPGNEQFQNLLWFALKDMNPDKRCWVENESLLVGSCAIPKDLWEQMNISPLVRMDLARDLRLSRAYQEYAHFSAEVLAEKVLAVKKRLGDKDCRTAITALQEDRRAEAVDILMRYYDKTYQMQFDKRKNQCLAELHFDFFDAGQIAVQLCSIKS